MNFKIILFVACGLVLVTAHHHYHGRHGDMGSYWQRHVHRWYRHEPLVQFEVQEPKGLTVSRIQRSPNTTFFAIELFVNRDPSYYNNIHCDVCKNSTSVTFGKFIIKDEEVIIKKADVLYYYVLLGNSTHFSRSHLLRLWVSAEIIKRCNCFTVPVSPVIPTIDLRFGLTTAALGSLDHHPNSEVTPNAEDPVTATEYPFDDLNKLNELGSREILPLECDQDPITNQCRMSESDLLLTNQYLGREVEILEAIIEQLKQATCKARTTNVLMLLLEGTNLPTNLKKHMTSVVQSSLSVNPEMKELVSRIKSIKWDKRIPNIVFFDMFSYVDKLKVMYHARLNRLNYISDYDLRRF